MASESVSPADDWRRVLARAMTGRESGNILVFVAGHDDRTSPLAEAQEVIESTPRDRQLVLVFAQDSLFGHEWAPNLEPNVRVLSWKLKDDGAHIFSRHFITHTHTHTQHVCLRKRPEERHRRALALLELLVQHSTRVRRVQLAWAQTRRRSLIARARACTLPARTL